MLVKVHDDLDRLAKDSYRWDKRRTQDRSRVTSPTVPVLFKPGPQTTRETVLELFSFIRPLPSIGALKKMVKEPEHETAIRVQECDISALAELAAGLGFGFRSQPGFDAKKESTPLPPRRKRQNRGSRVSRTTRQRLSFASV